MCGVSILQRAVQAQASSSDAIVQESTATPTTASGGLDVPVIGSSHRPGGAETTVPNVSGDLAALLPSASCMLGEHTEARLVSDMLFGRPAGVTLCGPLRPSRLPYPHGHKRLGGACNQAGCCWNVLKQQMLLC